MKTVLHREPCLPNFMCHHHILILMPTHLFFKCFQPQISKPCNLSLSAYRSHTFSGSLAHLARLVGSLRADSACCTRCTASLDPGAPPVLSGCVCSFLRFPIRRTSSLVQSRGNCITQLSGHTFNFEALRNRKNTPKSNSTLDKFRWSMNQTAFKNSNDHSKP